MSAYKVKHTYYAKDIVESRSRGTTVTKLFDAGQVVYGKPYAAQADSIIAEGRFIFPASYLELATDVRGLRSEEYMDSSIDTANQVIDTATNDIEKLQKDVRDVITNRMKDRVYEISRSYKRGALVGLAVGVVSALYFQKSVWLFGALGLLTGGYVGSKIGEAQAINFTSIKKMV